MTRLFVIFLLAAVAPICCTAQNSLASTNFAALTREHTDGLCILYNPSGSNLLSLITWQRDAGLDLPTNQVIFVVKPESKLTLPPGTPFGDEGAPFWILPQSQNPSLLYLGINSERVPFGVFTGPLAIRLKRFEGPGYFMAWQATGPGQFNIRVNTRDGIDAGDFFSPLIGAHEHFNWGFSKTGVYSANFQVTGQRIGESTNIFSPESTFVFHVQPLPAPTNYVTWARGYWPPGFDPPTTLPNGNPDGDPFDNLYEYAFNLSPTNSNGIGDAPSFSLISTNDQSFGALSFTRYKPAADLSYQVEAANTLPGPWEIQSDLFGVVPDTNGVTDRVTIRDPMPAASSRQRFYRLRVSTIP